MCIRRFQILMSALVAKGAASLKKRLVVSPAQNTPRSWAAHPEVRQAVAALHVLYAQKHLPVGVALVLQAAPLSAAAPVVHCLQAQIILRFNAGSATHLLQVCQRYVEHTALQPVRRNLQRQAKQGA